MIELSVLHWTSRGVPCLGSPWTRLADTLLSLVGRWRVAVPLSLDTAQLWRLNHSPISLLALLFWTYSIAFGVGSNANTLHPNRLCIAMSKDASSPTPTE